MNFIATALDEAITLLQKLQSNKDFQQQIQQAIDLLAHSFANNQRVFSCGNGGSLCDSMHFAEELTGRFRQDRKPLAAVAISDPSHLSCVSNDYGYDQVFSRYLEAWGNPGDVLVAFSTSGNSPNILKACQVARQKGMRIIGMLGKGGGQAKGLVDLPLIVPSQSTDRIQEIHIKLVHFFIEGIEKSLKLITAP